MKVVFEIPSKGFQFDSFKLPTHNSYNLKKSFYLLSWKSLSCIKFQIWTIFRWNSNLFKTLFISNGRCHIIFTLGFCDEMNLNSWTSNCKDESFGKVLLFPLIQLSKSFKFHPFHTINHTNNHIYLINITFQNLEFWDVRNLPHLKWISSSRFEEASKKRLGFGGSSSNTIDRNGLVGYHT